LSVVRSLIFICNILAIAGIFGLPLYVAAQNGPRSLYDGASVWFAQSQLLKPRENTNHSRAYQLAPLFVQEISTTNATPSSNPNTARTMGFGASKPTQAMPKVAHTVHFQSGAVLIHGQTREQMMYWWHYGGTRPPVRQPPARRGPELRPVRRAKADTPWMGLRLTLNTNGVPVIYEVFDSRRDLQPIFVAQSIAAAAQAEFGPALPGRRHSVEPSLSAAPKSVVARVIENSPDVMGPILYLHAESRSVATLICRCMDAQAQELVRQDFYELVPADTSGKLPAATRLETANPRGLPKDFFNPSDRLSRSLRLPRDF
jgi:hypothetical protein